MTLNNPRKKLPFRIFGTMITQPRPMLSLGDTITEWSCALEYYGFDGALLYHNLRTIDPWIVAMAVLRSTSNLCPLVATQCAELPPFALARQIAATAAIFERRINLNIVIGANASERKAVGDHLSHDDRYARCDEYLFILKELLHGRKVTLEGRFYHIDNVSLEPALVEKYMPRIFIAGSSQAAFFVGQKYADVIVMHPPPWEEFSRVVNELFREPKNVACCVRIGILARGSAAEAWDVARTRFPVSRAGLMKSKLQRESESHWARSLAEYASRELLYDEVYWLGAFSYGRSSSPCLVGSYREVGRYLRRYRDLGIDQLLLSGPEDIAEIAHILEALDHV